MKSNFIHVVFVIDASGSMCGSEADVIGGFRRVVEEQKANENGSCVVSVFEFDNYVRQSCFGVNVEDINSNLDYAPGGATALFDAIGTAIETTHNWNMKLDETERPEKTMVVIMTDGEENVSHNYSGSDINKMIKEFETEFGWSFVYLGADLSNVNDAETLGIRTRGVSTKGAMMSNYDAINASVSCFRAATGDTQMKYATMDSCLSAEINTLNTAYYAETGIQIDDDTDNK